VNRLYGGHPSWVAANRFAQAFQGGCWPERTSAYRISRWETAAVRVPHLAVRRYEQLLDVQAGSLVALVDTVYRYFAPTVSAPPLLGRRTDVHGADGPGRLEELLEVALSGAPVAGADWDELTARLAAAPRQVIAPRTVWRDLAERLLAEMIIADGVPWMQRHEALHRLLAHPVGQQAAVAACADLAADRTGQVFVETVSVLDGSPHPDAGRHLLAQLVDPTNDRAQYGALLGSIRKLRYGHFTGAQMMRLVPALHDLLADSAPGSKAPALAAELLRRLRDEPRGGARHDPGPDRTPRPQREIGRADGATRAVAARLARATRANLPHDIVPFDDRLLPVLLHEMLFDPVFDVRLYAAMLLAGTPYREPLAAALGSELAVAAAGGPVEWTVAMIEALRVVGTSRQRPVVERLTLADGPPPSVTVAAVQAVGHIGGRSDDRYWRRAIHHHSVRWRQTRATTHASALVGLVYALGIGRNRRMLHVVRQDPTAPAECRAAASWWLNLPAHILDSAVR
jgi:hypothetical protein